MARSPGVYGIGSSGEALADRPNGRATAPIFDGERPSAIEADRSRRGTGPISRYAARYGIELPAGMIGEFIGPDGEAR